MSDDHFIILPRVSLPPIKYLYKEGLSLSRMRANPDFELREVVK